MRQQQRGFGLIEIMIAMTLGLVILIGVVNVFISAKDTYRKQSRAAALQEDGRFLLSKMVQEIRQVGMYGCLSNIDTTNAATFVTPKSSPVTYVTATAAGVTTTTLTLNTADVGSSAGTPTWTIVSDCLTSATAYTGVRAPASGQVAFPIRQIIYTYNSLTDQMSTTIGGTTQVLVGNITNFTVLFGISSTSTDTTVSSYTATPTDTSLIRTMRLSITMDDGSGQVRPQQFNVVAAIRNRLN